MYQSIYLKLISGENRGFGPTLAHLLLRIPEPFYLSAVSLRNLLYSKGYLKTHHADAVVFSIGNITTGGTGKTPLVIWLCNLLKNRGINCAILTRGYKATLHSRFKTQNYLDEPAILAQSCPHTEIIVNPDRIAGAAEAIGRSGVQALIMDDGFQHRRLHRDLDIVVIDATRPFGYGRLLPAGLLREPIGSLKRADAVVITRCDQVTLVELTELESKLQNINSRMIISRSIHAPTTIKSPDKEIIQIEHLKNRRVFAYCGIGNPTAFLNTIQNLGTKIVGSEVFDDHHHYSQSDIENICRQAKHGGADLVLTTQKDWTKTASLSLTDLPIHLAYLTIEIRFTDGQDKLRGLIEQTMAGKIPPKR